MRFFYESFPLLQLSLVQFWHSSASRIFSLHFWSLDIWSFSWFLHCLRPKSLGMTDTSPSNSVFSFFVLQYDIRSQCFVFYVHARWDHQVIVQPFVEFYLSLCIWVCDSASLFSVMAFGSCFHEFSGTGMLNILQICHWITLHTLLCLCVCTAALTWFFSHPDRRWLVLSVSTLQNRHLSD